MEADTFTVATGSGNGAHVYLKVDDLPETTKAMGTPLGNIELKSDGQQCVAPVSIHPKTGQAYSVYLERPIRRVSDVSKILEWIKAQNPQPETPTPKASRREGSNTNHTYTGHNFPSAYVNDVLQRIEQIESSTPWNDKGWINFRSPLREDTHASAGFNRITLGYNDFAGETMGIVKFAYRAFGIDIKHYLPKQQPRRPGLHSSTRQALIQRDPVAGSHAARVVDFAYINGIIEITRQALISQAASAGISRRSVDHALKMLTVLCGCTAQSTPSKRGRRALLLTVPTETEIAAALDVQIIGKIHVKRADLASRRTYRHATITRPRIATSKGKPLANDRLADNAGVCRRTIQRDIKRDTTISREATFKRWQVQQAESVIAHKSAHLEAGNWHYPPYKEIAERELQAGREVWYARQQPNTYRLISMENGIKSRFVTPPYKEVLIFLRLPFASVSDSDFATSEEEFLALIAADVAELNKIDPKTIKTGKAQGENAPPSKTGDDPDTPRKALTADDFATIRRAMQLVESEFSGVQQRKKPNKILYAYRKWLNHTNLRIGLHRAKQVFIHRDNLPSNPKRLAIRSNNKHPF